MSSSCPLTAPSSRCLIVQAGCCVASRHATISSSRHAALLSSCRPLTVMPSCCVITPSGCCVAPCHAVVLSSHCPLTHNVTHGPRDNGGCCPPPPRTSNVVVGVGLAIVSRLPSPSPWMLFLALQPCRHSNRSCRHCQCLFHCPPPSPTLVAVTITITLFVTIAIARAAAKLLPTSRSHTAATTPDAASATIRHQAMLRCLTAALPPPPRRRQAAADLALSHCHHHHCRRCRAAIR